MSSTALEQEKVYNNTGSTSTAQMQSITIHQHTH